jgi:hypothetical protein
MKNVTYNHRVHLSQYSSITRMYPYTGAKAASVSAASLAISGDPEAAADSVAKLLKETIEKRKQPRRVFGQGHTHRYMNTDNIKTTSLRLFHCLLQWSRY